MLKLRIALFVIVSMLVFVACDEQEAIQEETPKPSKVLNVSEVTTTTTVESIDLEHRLAFLIDENETMIVVEVAPDVDLTQISKGDIVAVTYLESTAFYVTAPDSNRPAVAEMTTKDVSKPGEEMSKVTVSVREEVVTIESIDVENREVTLKDANGNLKHVDVADDVPYLENAKVGDQVVMQFTKAFAVSVVKVEKK